MTYDLNCYFKDVLGKELAGTEGQKVPTIGEQMAGYAFSCEKIGGKELDSDLKYKVYLLSRKLAHQPCTLDVEECKLLLDMATDILVPGAYGQLKDIIDKAE